MKVFNQPNSHWFHLGKEARKNGQECRITDGRMRSNARQEFYEGWNYQDALMRGPPTEEFIQQNEAFFADLRAELRKPDEQAKPAGPMRDAMSGLTICERADWDEFCRGGEV